MRRNITPLPGDPTRNPSVSGGIHWGGGGAPGEIHAGKELQLQPVTVSGPSLGQSVLQEETQRLQKDRERDA